MFVCPMDKMGIDKNVRVCMERQLMEKLKFKRN